MLCAGILPSPGCRVKPFRVEPTLIVYL
jgi:hypothetical protein